MYIIDIVNSGKRINLIRDGVIVKSMSQTCALSTRIDENDTLLLMSEDFLMLRPWEIPLEEIDEVQVDGATVGSNYNNLNEVIEDIDSNTNGPSDTLNNGLMMWLDATDKALLDTQNPSTTDGALIQYWTDKSGNTNRAVQNTAGNRPQYYNQGFGGKDKPYMLFGWNLPSLVTFMTVNNEGGDNYPISKLPNSSLVVVVEPVNEPANSMMVIGEGPPTPNADFASLVVNLRNGTKEIENYHGDGVNYSVTETPPDTWSLNPMIIIMTYTDGDTNSTIRFNGIDIEEIDVISGASNIGGTKYFTSIGKYGESFSSVTWLEAKLAEIRVWDRPLTVAEQIILESQLAYKYGIGIGISNGLVLNLDASSTPSINTGVPTDGTPVEDWKDSGPTNNDANQPTLGNRPLWRANGFGPNNLPYIEFTSANQHWLNLGKTLSKLLEYTVITVHEPNSYDGQRCIIAEHDPGPAQNLASTGIYIDHTIDGDYTLVFGDGTPTGSFRVQRSLYEVPSARPIMISKDHEDGTAFNLYKDGGRDSRENIGGGLTSISGTKFDLVIGRAGEWSNRYFDGKIAQIKIWNRKLSFEELETEHHLLNQKWAIWDINDFLIFKYDFSNPACYPGSGTTVTDLSGNGQNGTMNGGITFSTDDGGIMDFNGTDGRIDLGTLTSSHPLSLQGNTGDATFIFWIKVDQIDDIFPRLLSRSNGATGANGYDITLGEFDANVNLYIDSSQRLGTTPIAQPIGQWLHVAVRMQNASVNDLFINGVKQSNVETSTNNVPAVDTACRIGGWTTDLTRQFDGKMGSIEVYNKPMLTAEIENNFNNTKTRFGL